MSSTSAFRLILQESKPFGSEKENWFKGLPNKYEDHVTFRNRATSTLQEEDQVHFTCGHIILPYLSISYLSCSNVVKLSMWPQVQTLALVVLIGFHWQCTGDAGHAMLQIISLDHLGSSWIFVWQCHLDRFGCEKTALIQPNRTCDNMRPQPAHSCLEFELDAARPSETCCMPCLNSTSCTFLTHKGNCYVGQLMRPSTYRVVCKPCLLQTAPGKPYKNYFRHCATWYASWNFNVFHIYVDYFIFAHTKAPIDTCTHVQGNREAKHTNASYTHAHLCSCMCAYI